MVFVLINDCTLPPKVSFKAFECECWHSTFVLVNSSLILNAFWQSAFKYLFSHQTISQQDHRSDVAFNASILYLRVSDCAADIFWPETNLYVYWRLDNQHKHVTVKLVLTMPFSWLQQYPFYIQSKKLNVYWEGRYVVVFFNTELKINMDSGEVKNVLKAASSSQSFDCTPLTIGQTDKAWTNSLPWLCLFFFEVKLHG